MMMHDWLSKKKANHAYYKISKRTASVIIFEDDSRHAVGVLDLYSRDRQVRSV